MNNRPAFEIGSGFDDKVFKSCFARSVAVNSQFKQSKSMDFQPLRRKEETEGRVLRETPESIHIFTEDAEAVRFRKSTRANSLNEARRFSCGSIRRPSFATNSRISEIPVESMANQSKIEALEWQLKEIEKSREMYRAVMKQVVTFLEKAHHSLELMGKRLNTRRKSVPRSKSDHHIISETSCRTDDETASTSSNTINRCLEDDRVGIMDYSWQSQKKPDRDPEETPPEKLSQEAFRLLRTARSLLSTREPDLAHLDPPDDIEFLAQLAREFPQATPPVEQAKPQRCTSFSLSPKLLLPDGDIKVATALNRKLSLQLNEVRRSPRRGRMDSARGSVAESDIETTSGGKEKKANLSATGSISSAEDESGFSSMNSFQDVGLPLVNSTMNEEVSTKNALLRSMLHNNSDYSSLSYLEHNSLLDTTVLAASKTFEKQKERSTKIDDIKLWQKPCDAVPQHKRWFSSPAAEETNKQTVKVLWV